QRLWRPIVRIGVRTTRPRGGSSPCSPAEERRQLAYIFRICNRLRPQAELGRGFSEKCCVVVPAFVERPRLGIRVNERAGRLVVSIRLEILDGLATRRIGA